MKPPATVLRARAVRRALDRFGRRDAQALSDGLSAQNARACLDRALEPLTVEALAAAAETDRPTPRSVTVVVARGVYTSPVEWAALYATAGMAVHLKAPSGSPQACLALAEDLAAEGLPVTAGTGRDLGGRSLSAQDAVVVFGADQTGPEVRAAHPDARVVAFGHRVAAAVVDVPGNPAALQRLARALVEDCVAYDSRGCMAPVVVVARGPLTAPHLGDAWGLQGALADALAEADRVRPPGALAPALGPEWRRRLSLARIRGTVVAGERWAVPVVALYEVPPAALPRMLCVAPVPPGSVDLRHLPLGSLALATQQPVLHHAPRVVAPGQLQRPAFPRLHDGVDMLECVLGAHSPT